jgi:proteasome lid subunit RPN8/RPN11
MKVKISQITVLSDHTLKVNYNYTEHGISAEMIVTSEHLKDRDLSEESLIQIIQESKSEECWVIIGKKLFGLWIGKKTQYSLGEPSAVNFDPDWVRNRMETKNDVIGFLHTHPNSEASPSLTDYKTMHGWVAAEGKPILCMIEGTDGLRAHWFVDYESSHIEAKVWRWGNWFFGFTKKKVNNVR